MNCIIIDDDAIIQKQIAAFINKSELLNLKGTFINPLEAISIIKNEKIDVVFLDIEMPEMSGLEFLDESKFDFSIIVISGDRKYALDTFEYDVIDYLLKPIEYKRFLKAVNKAIERNFEKTKTHYSDSLFLKLNGGYLRLKSNDIVFVKYQLDKKLISTNKKSYTVSNSIFNLETICQNSNFFKISEEFIVNLNEICEVCDNYLIFKNQEIFENILVSEDVAYKVSAQMNVLKNDLESRTFS